MAVHSLAWPSTKSALRDVPCEKPIRVNVSGPVDHFENRAVLMGAALFRGLSLGECAIMVSAAREERLPARATAFREGDMVNSVAFIATGWVKITQVSRAGEEVILRVDAPGEVEPAIANSGFHLYTARTITPCNLLRWQVETFEDLIRRFRRLQQNLGNVLAERLQRMEERFLDLATTHVHQRLARLLLFLHEHQAEPLGVQGVGFSCEELAQMTGTTLYSVSRILCDWEERDIVQREHKVIKIADLRSLVEIAEHTNSDEREN